MAVVAVVAFSPSTQGEDRPCFVKRFLPAELFSRYQSAGGSLGDLGEKIKITYPELPGSPWRSAPLHQSIYCHFNGLSGCLCRAGWRLHISQPVNIEVAKHTKESTSIHSMAFGLPTPTHRS